MYNLVICHLVIDDPLYHWQMTVKQCQRKQHLTVTTSLNLRAFLGKSVQRYNIFRTHTNIFAFFFFFSCIFQKKAVLLSPVLKQTRNTQRIHAAGLQITRVVAQAGGYLVLTAGRIVV